jgi:hypothetical protein
VRVRVERAGLVGSREWHVERVLKVLSEWRVSRACYASPTCRAS